MAAGRRRFRWKGLNLGDESRKDQACAAFQGVPPTQRDGAAMPEAAGRLTVVKQLIEHWFEWHVPSSALVP